MKQAHTKAIDTRGLRKAVTTVAIAGALAGWAVLARPETPTAAVPTTTGSEVAVAPAAGAGAATSSAAAAASSVAPATSGLRVVAMPAPATTTRSSR